MACREYECLLASKKVDYHGQAIGLLVADTYVSVCYSIVGIEIRTLGFRFVFILVWIDLAPGHNTQASETRFSFQKPFLCSVSADYAF